MQGRRLVLLLVALPAVYSFMAPSPTVISLCKDFAHLAPYTAAQILGRPELATTTASFMAGATRLRATSSKGFVSSLTASMSPFKVNLMGDTSLTVKNFGLEACLTLGAETNKLIAAFKAVKASEAAGGKREIQETFAFSWTDGASSLQMECNPNLFTNAFNAKVFVMFEDENIKISSQAALPELIDSIKDFKSRNSESP